jgi:predicted outer membrane repeat protein
MSEICDSADTDENCSGAADDADAGVLDSTRSDFWADSDADTYTVAAATRFCDMPAGFLAAASTLVDCNDGDAGVNPGMTELCDAANVDENCNNVADNDDAGAADSTKFDFFADADSDSYSVATATRFCDIVPGFVAIVSTSVDCDDSSSAVYPGAAELCATATVDNNCDGSTNDVDATAADKVPFYRDSDLDGFTTVQASRFCPGTLNSGWLEVPSASVDCDDSSNASYPGAVELCATASVDNNCDGSATDVDANAADKVDFFRDSDLDGFSTAETAKYCPGSTQSGWLQIASTQADCNDLDGAISPAATEICDASNVDENCNGASDDNDAGVDDATRSDFFADADADGVGSDGAVRFCDMPAGYSATGGDTCPSDPLKQAPGTCGCGVVDLDANSNGVIDCVEIGVSLQPSLTIVRPGVDFTVSVNSTTPVVPVVGLQVALTFDPAMLEVTGADPTGPFESLLGFQVNNQAGTVLVGVGTLGEPVTTGGSMISVRFKVKANAPTDCDARERISFDASRPVTSRFSRVDGTAFLPVLEPMLAFTVDGAAPTISSVPQDSAQASADCSAVVPDMIGLVVATDDCTSAAGLVVTQSPAAGSSLGLGTHPVTFTVTDAAGNAAVLAGSFQVNGASLDYYDDADLDTFGSALASAQASCHPVAGKVPNNTDCDDSSAAAYPGALELCADATVDNNCDGNAIDVDANAADKVDFYRDGDVDGYTTLETAKFCPGTSNAGYRSAVTAAIDCNDADSSVFPGAVENCANAGIDNDCDTIAADDAEAIDSIAYMLDADQDGFGAGPALMSCSPVPGRVTNADDCDDTQVLYVDTDGDGVGAGSPAACGVPSNNDGCPSNANLTSAVTYYVDLDADGSGNPSASQQSCDSVAPAGFSTNSNDLCDGNSQLLTPRTYYTDADGDGFGDVGTVTQFCETSAPAGFSTDSSDCDDGAVLYADADGDGVGAGVPAACGVPSNNDGCPNNAALIAIATYYRDLDGDGAGDSTDSIQSCDSPAPAGYSAAGGDTCPNDPAKTAPGACGCGVADTDTDSDGLADCVDNCPSVANANQLDCNSNGTGDACELAAGTDQDCNANGFLDSCDLASGTSTDLDGSGAPDDCEYVVGGSGYASIQAAIDAAPNGTTIKVAPGTWAPISVSSRALVIQGIGSRDVTFIDGGSSARAVEISGSAGSRFILRGFTIRNGRAAEGAGLLITDGGPLVENCVFTGNIATGIGGAVRAINSAADFALCSFTSNSAASGGAVANSGIAASGATLNFSSCQFRSNTASTDGGAIANSGRLFLLECTVEQNTAGSLGGGVRQLETGDTTIFTSRFCMNVPDNINGAFTAVGDNILSDDCNANGLCDADEIAAGDVRDCNSNGVIDSCEITGGAADIDGDGRLDRCEILRGDLDLDGLVNGVDLALILTNWGTSGSRGDVNGDGIVDGADLTIVLGGWGVVPSF